MERHPNGTLPRPLGVVDDGRTKIEVMAERGTETLDKVQIRIHPEMVIVEASLEVATANEVNTGVNSVVVIIHEVAGILTGHQGRVNRKYLLKILSAIVAVE